MLTEQRLNRAQAVVSVVERQVNETLGDRSYYCSSEGLDSWFLGLDEDLGIERYEVREALSILRTRSIQQVTGDLGDKLQFIDDFIDMLEPANF